MKSVSNLLLVAVIIIYVFLPLFDLGIFGGQTGFEFTELTLNRSGSFGRIVFALIPFIACFGAITLNCLKNKLWRLASCVFIGFGLYFYYNAGNYETICFGTTKILGLGIGYNVSLWLLWGALVADFISLIPYNFKNRKNNDVTAIPDR